MHRNVVISAFCLMCKSDDEDLIQALWNCRRLLVVWETDEEIMKLTRQKFTSFADLWTALLLKKDRMDVKLLVEATELGIVIRDSFGRVISSLAKRVPLPSLVATVEALACRRALLFAKELCIFKAVVEGDAEVIIRALQGREVLHPEYGHVIQDSLALATEFCFCGRVNGTFTSKTYDDIVKELVEKFHMEINKDKSKPAAKKWMTTPMSNYSKMAQLWAKDRAKGDHAETTKEKRARYTASTTIDEIDNLVSQNEVSLENFEVEDDQKSPEINVVCSRVSSQDAMSSKSKKR
nr:hypothetical protein CFP56_18066 [Quercus suber]